MWVEQRCGDELYFQRSGNLSVGGLYLADTIPHPIGTRIQLQFTLPGETQALRVQGEIVNTQGLGMGVRFVDLPPDVAERIARYIAHHS
jgi:uncharacterized protein (TIGR02266 family)